MSDGPDNIILEIFRGTEPALHTHIQREIDASDRVPGGTTAPYRVWPTPTFDVWIYLYGHEESNGAQPMPQWAVDAFRLQRPRYHTCFKSPPETPDERRAKLKVVK